MGQYSRGRLGDARQSVRNADAAGRRCRSGAATVAFAVVAFALVAAHGRDDHRSGQQFRTAYAAGRVRVRFRMPAILARVA